jgi:hypothetical protein
LRGLAAPAPYFHNGAASNLSQVVNFHNGRFQIGLTAQQMVDLINFLRNAEQKYETTQTDCQFLVCRLSFRDPRQRAALSPSIAKLRYAFIRIRRLHQPSLTRIHN